MARRRLVARGFRARRSAAGLTIDQLADRAGVDRKSVMRLENSTSVRMDWAVLIRVSDALGAELRDVLPYRDGQGVLVARYDLRGD